MLLILRSRAAFSLLKGSFGSLRFFSLGTSPTRGWRWPTGACITPPPPPPVPPEFFGTDEDPCANASAPQIRTTSAIERIVVRILILPFAVFSTAPARRSLRNCGVPDRRSPAPFVHRPWCRATRFRRPPAPRRSRASRHFRCRDGPHLPAAPVSPRRPPPSQVTALADRGERRRNSRRYDTAFPR